MVLIVNGQQPEDQSRRFDASLFVGAKPSLTFGVPEVSETVGEAESVIDAYVAEPAISVVVPEPEAVFPVEVFTLEPVAVAPAFTPSLSVNPVDENSWKALYDRIFDLDCTEVRLLPTDLDDPDGPYRCFVTISTRVYPEPGINFTSPEAFTRILNERLIPHVHFGKPYIVGDSEADPVVTGSLLIEDVFEDGSVDVVRGRVQLITPPAGDGITLLIFKQARTDLDLNDLVANQSMDVEMASFLAEASEGGVTIVFSGVPGAGKTTLLQAIAREISSSEVVSVIQEIDELPLTHLTSKIKMHTYLSEKLDLEDVKKGTVEDLIKVTKQARPSRVIVGECRGAEMYDFLDAAIIYEGCMTTIHAQDSESALDKIVALASKKPNISISTIQQAVAQGVDVIVQVGTFNGRHIVTEIREVQATYAEAVNKVASHILWQHVPEEDAWIRQNSPSDYLRNKAAHKR